MICSDAQWWKIILLKKSPCHFFWHSRFHILLHVACMSIWVQDDKLMCFSKICSLLQSWLSFILAINTVAYVTLLCVFCCCDWLHWPVCPWWWQQGLPTCQYWLGLVLLLDSPLWEGEPSKTSTKIWLEDCSQHKCQSQSVFCTVCVYIYICC